MERNKRSPVRSTSVNRKELRLLQEEVDDDRKTMKLSTSSTCGVTPPVCLSVFACSVQRAPLTELPLSSVLCVSVRANVNSFPI